MNKEVLKRIIIESQEFIQTVGLINRQITIDENANYVFVGQRRTGKTYFMFQLIRELIRKKKINIERVLYINFEDERLLEFHFNDFDRLIESYRELFRQVPVCFFDEIQNIKGWEKFARRLSDQNFKVYITGSNATMLSREISTVLGGRFMVKEIFGLSFHEYLSFHGVIPESNFQFKEQRFEIQKLFNDYLYFGALPEVNKFENKKEYLSNIFEKVFYGDIVARHHIKNDFGLKLLVKKIAESTMDETSFNRLKNIIKSSGIGIGTQTLIEYFGYLNDAYLIFNIGNYNSKFVERETSRKFYFSDTGVLSLFLFNPESMLLETLVYNHLRRIYGEDVYYYRDNSEVDFYLPGKAMIQVAFSLHKDQTMKRELDGLQKASEKVQSEEFKIITMSEEEVLNYKDLKIEIIPAWKWLLSGYLSH